jgi:hypothetical protein
VPSTDTFIVEGAVPETGDLLNQVLLLADVQVSVPPPVLLMPTYPLE